LSDTAAVARASANRNNQAMARVFIGIGSNVGDRAAHLAQAREALASLAGTKLVAFSRIYETAPVGPVPQGEYLNAAAELDTQLEPLDLLDKLRAIEAGSGRAAESQRVKWGPRTLDLDILLYDDRVIASDRLHVPHPHMHGRRFVLEPLADIAPEARHPTAGATIRELLRRVVAAEAQHKST